MKDLERLGPIPGRADAIGVLGSVMTEYQARFIETSLRMLANYSESKSPITAIAVPGPVIARDRDNA